MVLLDDVKDALRVNGTDCDTEITDLISAAKTDLIISGVSSTKAEDATDPLIKRAVVVYCKANYGYDNQEAERFQQSYEMLKEHLSLSADYQVVTT